MNRRQEASCLLESYSTVKSVSFPCEDTVHLGPLDLLQDPSTFCVCASVPQIDRRPIGD